MLKGFSLTRAMTSDGHAPENPTWLAGNQDTKGLEYVLEKNQKNVSIALLHLYK